MIDVIFYSRPDCHLCEEALEELEALQESIPHKLTIVNVDEDEKALRKYGLEIPVIEVGPYRLKAPFTSQQLQITLGAANDRQRDFQALEKGDREVFRGAKWTSADGFSYWLSKHYMLMFNLFVLLYVGLPVLAPALMRIGAEAPANLIYRAYGFACHQQAYRSFFLFGEQPVYPREAAGVEGLVTYGQATGLSEGNDPDSYYVARNFVGNPEVGYKMALCQRDIAIYFAIFLFGVIFALTGQRIPPLPWYWWILLGLVPVGLDGVSQLISQPPISLLPYRESTPFFRSLTGFLFGFTTAWFGYPLVEETMLDTRRILGEKLSYIQRNVSRQGSQHPAD